MEGDRAATALSAPPNRAMPYPRRTIGLTGGIATGKSTAADYLARKRSLPVLDADRYARDAVAPGTAIARRVRDRYGAAAVAGDGTLDRRALGDIVFGNRDERGWLEAQIHPVVRDRLQRELLRQTEPTAVIVVPLLFEANMTDLATEIWVVGCSEAQQLARLCARNGLDRRAARQRIAAQWPLARKLAAADVCLDNSSTPAHLYRQLDAALQGKPPVEQ